jgi:hypothetical protein
MINTTLKFELFHSYINKLSIGFWKFSTTHMTIFIRIGLVVWVENICSMFFNQIMIFDSFFSVNQSLKSKWITKLNITEILTFT